MADAVGRRIEDLEEQINHYEQLLLKWGKAYKVGDYVKADGVLTPEYNRLCDKIKEDAGV